MKPTLIVLLTFLSGGLLDAQSVYLQRGETGPGVEGRFSLRDGSDLKGGTVALGYSISGTMDFGIALYERFYEVGSSGAEDTGVALYTGALVARQGRLPLSLRLWGTYGLVFVDSDYYDDRDESRQGRGFSVGLDVFRDIPIASGLAFRLGVGGGYESMLYVTDTREASAAPYPVRQRESDLTYGGFLGVVLRTRGGTALALACSAKLDSDASVVIEPSIALASGAPGRRR